MRKWLWILLVVAIAVMLPYSLKAQDRMYIDTASLFID
jgi:hypothetical protein